MKTFKTFAEAMEDRLVRTITELLSEDEDTVTESMTPISTSGLQRHPFATSAVNNGFKHTGSWQDGKVQKHEFQHPTKGNVHLVNHGANFWTAHAGNKQFRSSPSGADEVGQFHKHLGSL
jgi:hypothetical protein